MQGEALTTTTGSVRDSEQIDLGYSTNPFADNFLPVAERPGYVSPEQQNSKI
jgi:hypothetical protein